MARYLYKIISLKEIQPTSEYCFRTQLDNPRLEASVARQGVIQPLIVTGEARPRIVAGHRRFYAAQKSGLTEIPVLQISGEPAPGPEDCFVLSVLSNWNQVIPEMDLARIIFKAFHEFKMSRESIAGELLPALGLDPKSGFLEESLEVFSLSPEVLNAIVSGNIPFRGSKILSRFAARDQAEFAGCVAAHASLTTNQLLKIGEWFCDLLKINRIDLKTYLRTNGLPEILGSDLDRKAKGERLFSRIRELRYPHLAEKEKKFASLSEQLREARSGVSVEAPAYFEAPGMTLRADLRDTKALESLVRVIESKRKVLNSLLDIVL